MSISIETQQTLGSPHIGVSKLNTHIYEHQQKSVTKYYKKKTYENNKVMCTNKSINVYVQDLFRQKSHFFF